MSREVREVSRYFFAVTLCGATTTRAEHRSALKVGEFVEVG
jgi:hypothetical protein